MERTSEIELPYCSTMRGKRDLTERMYGSNDDTLQPSVNAVPQMYAGDIGTLSLVPKNTQM